jgi:hypothetical protein
MRAEKRKRFVEALADGYSIQKCAEIADIKIDTARKWAFEPTIRQKKLAEHRQSLSRAISLLITGGPRVISEMYKLAIESPDPDTRLRACQAWTQRLEKVMFEHVDYQPEHANQGPMFILPAGTRPLAMIGLGQPLTEPEDTRPAPGPYIDVESKPLEASQTDAPAVADPGPLTLDTPAQPDELAAAEPFTPRKTRRRRKPSDAGDES